MHRRSNCRYVIEPKVQGALAFPGELKIEVCQDSGLPTSRATHLEPRSTLYTDRLWTQFHSLMLNAWRLSCPWSCNPNRLLFLSSVPPVCFYCQISTHSFLNWERRQSFTSYRTSSIFLRFRLVHESKCQCILYTAIEHLSSFATTRPLRSVGSFRPFFSILLFVVPLFSPPVALFKDDSACEYCVSSPLDSSNIPCSAGTKRSANFYQS